MSIPIDNLESFRSFFNRTISPHIPQLSLKRTLENGNPKKEMPDVVEHEPYELQRLKNDLTRTIFNLRKELRNGGRLTHDQWLNLFSRFGYGDPIHISSFIFQMLERLTDFQDVVCVMPQAVVAVIDKNRLDDLLVSLLRRSSLSPVKIPVDHVLHVVNLSDEAQTKFLGNDKVVHLLSRDLSELNGSTIFIDGWQENDDDKVFTVGRARELYKEYLDGDSNRVMVLLNTKNEAARNFLI